MTTRPALCLVLVLVTQTIAKKYGGGSPPRTDHSYPHSNTGYSGSGGGHGYPASGGKSGTGTGHGYPPSSGKSGTGYGGGNYGGNTVHHHHYHYSPPQQVRYGSATHPVYHGQPPSYVYQYRESGSPFGTLLAGLALYNLGRMTAGGSHHRDYRPNPGEKCMFAVKKDNGDYEETRVDCQLMTSFLFDMDSAPPTRPQTPLVADAASKPVDTSVVSIESGADNTTVVPANKTVDALELKGPEIQVTPNTHCFIIHMTRSSTRRKEVECGLLRTYERSSLRRNSAPRLKPYGEILFPLIVHLFVANFYSTN
ncbi:hypothetical protein JYU34_001745 [Plutella xylostella]|uniref:Uncharacterized protein n=1 Tax=Plutella xylostella TaxID=51655 RepID=A0ABQ7R4T8_PLUXY|nr:hypothetical protein JYU34_001745 [Plutella xylostella]